MDALLTNVFAEIGFTHIYCAMCPCNRQIESRIPNSADVKEIHEEQRELIAEYEALCKEAAWADSPAAEFSEGFGLELRRKRSEILSEEELRKLQEIIVKIQRIATSEPNN